MYVTEVDDVVVEYVVVVKVSLVHTVVILAYRLSTQSNIEIQNGELEPWPLSVAKHYLTWTVVVAEPELTVKADLDPDINVLDHVAVEVELVAEV